MPIVAQSARLLGRYGDLLGIVALFPFISHVKFAGVLEKVEKRRAQEEHGAKAAEQAKAGGKKKAAAAPAPQEPPKPVAEDAGYLPPAWALSLILLAEMIRAWSLFDPSDRKVRRAVGETLRVQKSSQGGGVEAALRSVERLLADEDVYFLIRSTASICGCGSLLISALAGLDRAKENPLSAALQGVRGFLRSILRPQLLGIAVLVAALVIGHNSALKNTLQKPGVADLVYALPALLRAVGLTGAAFSPSSDVLPTYAAINACAALAREVHLLVYERIQLPQLLEGGLFDAKPKLMGPRSVIAMELWSMLVLVPVAFTKRRFMLVLPLLALPCLWLASDAPIPSAVEPYIDLIIGRIVFCTAVMSLLIFFMGGFPTMTILILIAQVLTKIHKLDTLKP